MWTVPRAFEIGHLMHNIDHFFPSKLITYHNGTSTSLTCCTIIKRRNLFDVFSSFSNVHKLINSKILFEMRWTFHNFESSSICNSKSKSTSNQLLSSHLNLIDLQWCYWNFLIYIIEFRFRLTKVLKETFLLCCMLINYIKRFLLFKRTKYESLIELTMYVKTAKILLFYVSFCLLCYILDIWWDLEFLQAFDWLVLLVTAFLL